MQFFVALNIAVGDQMEGDDRQHSRPEFSARNPGILPDSLLVDRWAADSPLDGSETAGPQKPQIPRQFFLGRCRHSGHTSGAGELIEAVVDLHKHVSSAKLSQYRGP